MSEFKSIQEIILNEDNTATIKYQLVNQDSNQDVKFEGAEKITDEFKNIFESACTTIRDTVEVFQNKNIQLQKITFDNKKNTVMYSFLYYPSDNLHPVIKIDTPKLSLLTEPSNDMHYVSGVNNIILEEIKEEALKYIDGNTRTLQMKLEVVND